MISADNSQIADPIMRLAYEADIGFPIATIENNEIQFVSAMPAGRTAPAKIDGITYTTVPCVLFQHVPVTRSDPTLKGGKTIADGFAQFSVVAPLNKFTNQANAIANQIAALFPVAKRITLADGKVTIMRPVMPGDGYIDGAYWRVPVRVNYRAM